MLELYKRAKKEDVFLAWELAKNLFFVKEYYREYDIGEQGMCYIIVQVNRKCVIIQYKEYNKSTAWKQSRKDQKKNKRISQAKRSTIERHSSMLCKTFDVKIQKNQLNKS